MAADRSAIKMEYITANPKLSLRALAKKHGENKDRICRWAKEEDWETLRRQHQDKAETAVLEKEIQGRASRTEALYTAADLLLERVVEGIENTPILTATAANNYSSALKNIKDVQMIRTAEDIEEQRARIDKLRREAVKDDHSGGIAVTLEGDVSEYAK